MKKIASSIAFVLVLILCISAMVTPVMASGVSTPSQGPTNETEYISPQEQLQNYLARTDVTVEQKQAAIRKHQLGQQLAHSSAPIRLTRAAPNPLPVPFHRQINDYYCGPASVQQTIHYINGVDMVQSALAAALGTTSAAGTDSNKMANHSSVCKTDCAKI